jgi:hypothetical protein
VNPFWLVRMRRWVQHPPSPAKIRIVLAVVALCAALFAVERYVGWPDWLTTEPVSRHGVPGLQPVR